MIQVRGLGAERALAARVRRRVARVLARVRTQPVSATVTFVDDNGPKGGLAHRCAVTVRVPYRPSLRVEDVATTRRAAFDGALAALERGLERYREIQRERQRRPKKYYVAKRLLTSD